MERCFAYIIILVLSCALGGIVNLIRRRETTVDVVSTVYVDLTILLSLSSVILLEESTAI